MGFSAVRESEDEYDPALWKIFDGLQRDVRSLVWQHLSSLNPL